LVQSGWFAPDAIAGLVDTHMSGRADTSRTLWQLLMLERSIARLASV